MAGLLVTGIVCPARAEKGDVEEGQTINRAGSGAVHVDFYTKAVLTVIAIALSVIAVRASAPSSAFALGDGCGDASYNACYVRIDDTVSVRVR